MRPVTRRACRGRFPVRVAALLFALGGLAAGCGYGHLQTARPTPRGHLDVTIGQGLVYNKTIEVRAAEDDGSGVAIANLPMMINSRLGITDRLDIGLRLFLVGGAIVDTKVNFLSPKSRWALSGLAGFGAARDIGTKRGSLVHLPLSLHLSYDFRFGLTPYVALGYSLFWIYGRDAEPMAGVTYVDRGGHGDQLVTATFGLQLRVNRFVALLLEYNLWQPVVDDPGDFFSFERSHIVLFGVRIRGRIFGRRHAPPLQPDILPPPIDPGPPPIPAPSPPPPPPPPAP